MTYEEIVAILEKNTQFQVAPLSNGKNGLHVDFTHAARVLETELKTRFNGSDNLQERQ